MIDHMAFTARDLKAVKELDFDAAESCDGARDQAGGSGSRRRGAATR